mgnify:FL=1|jgi:predicted nucleotidyltransferase
MVVLGIISEYNPFNNGHLYHLRRSKEITKADAAIAIMSGNFTQRGEPALFDKWVRAEAAIKSGVNLVIELPVCYATSSAELFSYGAVSLLDRLGIVDYISFGSEEGNMKNLLNISDLLANESKLFKIYLRNFLKDGNSFAKARQLSLERLGIDAGPIRSPNNILGIEYLKWLNRLNSVIKPVTVKRIGSEYNQQVLSKDTFVSSATSIRKALSNSDLPAIKNHIPEDSYEVLRKNIMSGKMPIFKKSMEEIIFYNLLKDNDLKEIFDVSEGLNKRIKHMVYKSNSLENLLSNIKTKRYAYSRISRILFHSLLHYTKEEANIFNETGPLYARILGFDNVGRELIKNIDNHCSLTLVTNVSKQYSRLDSTAKKMLDKDILATDLYSLISTNNKIKLSRDFIKRPVVIS